MKLSSAFLWESRGFLRLGVPSIHRNSLWWALHSLSRSIYISDIICIASPNSSQKGHRQAYWIISFATQFWCNDYYSTTNTAPLPLLNQTPVPPSPPPFLPYSHQRNRVACILSPVPPKAPWLTPRLCHDGTSLCNQHFPDQYPSITSLFWLPMLCVVKLAVSGMYSWTHPFLTLFLQDFKHNEATVWQREKPEKYESYMFLMIKQRFNLCLKRKPHHSK